MALINPIKGMNATEVIELFENGSEYKLGKLKEKAVYLIAVHLSETNSPTIKSALNSLLESRDLERFAAATAKCFLPGNTVWPNKKIQ